MTTQQATGFQTQTQEPTRCGCGGRFAYAVLPRYAFTDDCGRTVEVRNIPAAVCERCGDAIVEPALVAEIGSRLSRRLFVPRHLDMAAD